MAKDRKILADEIAETLDAGMLPKHDPVVAFAARRCRERGSPVSEAMSPPLAVTTETSLDQIASLLETSGAHGAAVLDEASRLQGVVTRTDLLRALRRSLARASAGEGELPSPSTLGLTAADLLTRSPTTVLADATIAEAAALLARRDVQQLPVLAPSGRLVGMLTTIDLARWLGRSADCVSADNNITAFAPRSVHRSA